VIWLLTPCFKQQSFFTFIFAVFSWNLMFLLNASFIFAFMCYLNLSCRPSCLQFIRNFKLLKHYSHGQNPSSWRISWWSATPLLSLCRFIGFSERQLTFTFAICYRPSFCCLSVTAAEIEMPFASTTLVGPRNHLLHIARLNAQWATCLAIV